MDKVLRLQSELKQHEWCFSSLFSFPELFLNIHILDFQGWVDPERRHSREQICVGDCDGGKGFGRDRAQLTPPGLCWRSEILWPWHKGTTPCCAAGVPGVLHQQSEVPQAEKVRKSFPLPFTYRSQVGFWGTPFLHPQWASGPRALSTSTLKYHERFEQCCSSLSKSTPFSQAQDCPGWFLLSYPATVQETVEVLESHRPQVGS